MPGRTYAGLTTRSATAQRRASSRRLLHFHNGAVRVNLVLPRQNTVAFIFMDFRPSTKSRRPISLLTVRTFAISGRDRVWRGTSGEGLTNETPRSTADTMLWPVFSGAPCGVGRSSCKSVAMVQAAQSRPSHKLGERALAQLLHC